MLEHYLVQALRSLWRFKITSLINLTGLCLALVCFVATYLFLDNLLRNGDREFSKADRIYALTQELWTTPTNRMIPAFVQVAPGTAGYLRADLPQLEAVARALSLGTLACAVEDRSVYLFGAAVDPEFLRIFDFNAVEGDLTNALATTHSAIITEQAAMKLFGTRKVVGRSILLQNRTEVSIAAVIDGMPAGSHLGESNDSMLRMQILLPMNFLRGFESRGGIGVLANPDEPQWGNDSYWTYVLLPADGSVTLAQLEQTLLDFPERHIPKDELISVFGVVPLARVKLAMMEAFVGNRAISLTTAPFLIDALILAIACLNYANLAVAIATTRAREIGMRKVLGASQPHLIRQYLIEAALMGGAALILVLVGTALALPVVNSLFGLTFHLTTLLQPTLWGLVAALLVFIGLVGGAYPAFVLSRVRPVESLRASGVRAGPRFVPTILVGVQFAAASFLLVVAFLIAAQNQVLHRAGLHPERDPVVVVSNDIGQLGVPFDTLRSELLSDQRIRAVSGTATMPWGSGGPHQPVSRTQDAAGAIPTTMVNNVSYDFFETTGLRVLAGRPFDRGHADEFSRERYVSTGSAPVIIDLALARQLGWTRADEAVGQSIYPAGPWNARGRDAPFTVIGVVENGFPRLVGPNSDSNLFVLTQLGTTVPLVRISREDVPGALEHLDAVWKRLSPKAPMRRFFLDELFTLQYERYSMIGKVLSGLAACAFIIAVMGLIGMAVHITSRRLREIGIRKTLGATASGVVVMLLRDFSRPVIIANIVAWPFAFLAGSIYLNQFTQRASLSPWPFVLSFLITLAIAWLAVGAQALRAAAVKPANVLHMD